MSFDLAFYTAGSNAPAPSQEQVAQAITAVVNTAATRSVSPGGTPEWVYKSPQTSVSFRLKYIDPAASNIPAARDGARFSGLAVEVPYIRPRFVGIESLAASGAIAGRLGLLMPDPRTPSKAGEPINVVKTEPSTMNLTIEQWMEGNRWAIGNAQKLTGSRPPYLEPDRSMYWWRFQRMRQDIQKAVGRGAIVPSARVVRITKSGDLLLMTDWANGFPAVFPQVEIFLIIEAKSMDDPNAKAAWAPANEVMDRLRPILGRFEHPGCDLIACAGVPESGEVRDAFNSIPRYPLAGTLEDIGLNFIDEPEAAPAPSPS